MADQIQTIQEQVLQARSNGQKLNIVGGGSKSLWGGARAMLMPAL